MTALATHHSGDMSTVDKQFFVVFGARLRKLREAQPLTQNQLADIIGVSQPTIYAFEKGTRRIPLCYIPVLAELFEMSIDELLQHKMKKSKPRKPGPPSKLQKKLEKLEKLPRAQQRLVLRMIDGALRQAG